MKKILILAANPRKILNLDGEIRALTQAIERSPNSQQFEVIVKLAVCIEDLPELLLEHQPNIVHFCGSGGEQGLIFENKQGGEQWVCTEDLSDSFRLFEDIVECVLLNTCYSEVQADEIVKHIDYVIGMRQEIQDDAAIAFSKGFYQALGYGHTIEKAFEFGCNAIRLEKLGNLRKLSMEAEIPEHLKPILKIKPSLLTPTENAVNLDNPQEEKPEATDISATKIRELEFSEEISPPAEKPKGWAVIVGISEYEHQSWNLEYAHRDAEEFCKLLLTQTGGIFEEDRIQLLTNEQATKSNIESLLYDFLKKPDKDDLVIIFFACHGSPDPDRPDNIYFIPHDTKPDRIASSAILMKVISDIIGATLISKKVVIFADTCHSGNIGGGMGHRSLDSNELINKYLHNLTKSQSSIALLTSAEAKEVAREDQRWGGGHGVFTYYLLEGMKGEADQNKDGIITIGELFEYVREKVKIATDHKQHPAIGIDAFDRNLPIVMRSQITITTTRLTTSNENIFIQELPEGIILEMVKIPSGHFFMGSSNFWDEEKPRHPVEIQSFWLGKYLITQEQWRIVAAMDKISRDLNPDPSDPKSKGDKFPVQKVSWYEAMEFCARLSQYTGLKYRLPSEAEWEYACRAGTKTPYCCGMNLTRRYAHFGDSQGSTRSVGSLRANDWGLYDMHGNVWEWCADPWHDDYNNAPQNGEVWDENQLNNEFYENKSDSLAQFLNDERWRIMRGGSFGDNSDSCRSAYRIEQPPNANKGNTLGLRIVLMKN